MTPEPSPTWCWASRRRATRRRPPWWPTARSSASSVVSSQIDLHAAYGGVVPELAGRAHVDLLTPVVAEALARPASTRTAPGSTP